MKPSRLSLAILLLALVGCDDVVGPDSTCTRAKMQTRLTDGSPRYEGPVNSSGREYSQYWEYDDVVVIFRWGGSRDGCDVSRESLSSHYRALGIG